MLDIPKKTRLASLWLDMKPTCNPHKYCNSPLDTLETPTVMKKEHQTQHNPLCYPSFHKIGPDHRI
jgi:hypothetical protein